MTDLIIQENTCCQIDNFRVEVISHLGQFADVHYFKISIHAPDAQTEAPLGLLRVGNPDGGLSRELQLRQLLGDYKMVSELLAAVTEPLVSIWFPSYSPAESARIEVVKEVAEEIEESEHLQEKSYEEIGVEPATQKIILLSYLPSDEETLETWLGQENSLEASLLLASQVCQFFRYVYQKGWCFFQIIPKFIQFVGAGLGSNLGNKPITFIQNPPPQVGAGLGSNLGNKPITFIQNPPPAPVKFFDLTSVHRIGEKLSSGLEGDYCAPEIACGYPMDERMSTYVVGAILYQSIHHRLPSQDPSLNLDIKPIPRVYQLLAVCLSPVIEERFPLSQLLSLLVETRRELQTVSVSWDVAAHSCLGLSLERLNNEDNYGVRQQYSIDPSDSLILGVLADGMGGMAQGEVASSLAVQTFLTAPIPADFKNPTQAADWLLSLVKKANECVADNVRNGGTTLSVVMAIARALMIAHVGDSRILLLRNGQICQLSEDHSLVAMLLASGEITYSESKAHPNRNVLTQSIGSRRTLSNDDIQTLSRFGSNLSMCLENDDIILLCSDGVWDLVPADELAEIFSQSQSLNLAVNTTIDRVLAKDAHDNATILALKCCLETS